MPTRRSFVTSTVGLGATAALTGCLFDTTDDSSLAIHMEAIPRTDLGQNAVVTADDLGPRASAVVDRGLADGTGVYGTKPRDISDFVRIDGTYYAVGVRENGTETVERPVLEATLVSSADGSVSDWGNLSRSDAHTLRCAVSTRDERDNTPCVVYGGKSSAFWPEPKFRYLERGDDEYYRLRTTERSLTLDRYEYAFEPIAENRTAFADYSESELIAVDFSSVDLSAEQRNALDTAASEGTYRESPPYSAALRALVDQLQSADGNAERGVYVRFDGSYYEASYSQTWDD